MGETMIEFVIPGVPVAKGRPRFARRGNFVATFTPEKTATYETLVSWHAHQAMNGAIPLSGPVRVHIIATMPIPASATKKARAAISTGNHRHTKRPDLDNICKAITDGMNAIVYADDSQICAIGAEKVYGEAVGVSVRVVAL